MVTERWSLQGLASLVCQPMPYAYGAPLIAYEPEASIGLLKVFMHNWCATIHGTETM